ncbi:Conserved oligomeric Golgi complex subunit 5 [Oopsacas minuta]|uniref:Conserved oligomeric Golgi complex subunit 5 n=1 Tax=Oopsacas minuta TaxID=111878 RepID=A0AAV7JVC3_9METZ|nr:Conserved oligomeric Golgi complex subunit 5 [Oopsacas minuta]
MASEGAEEGSKLRSLGYLEQDELLRHSLQPTQDHDKSLAMTALDMMGLVDAISRLSQGLLLIEDDLQTEVAEKHQYLLAHARGVQELEVVLDVMGQRIATLTTSIEKIRTRVSEPFKHLRVRTVQLSRLQTACDLLRGVIRMLFLVKKLRGQVQSGGKEIIKAAQTLSDIAYLQSDTDLTGIQVLEDDLEFVAGARKDVERQALIMVHQGLEHASLSQVGVGLQVYNQLGDLELNVREALHYIVTRLQEEMQVALDHSAMQEPITSTSGSRTTQMTASSSVVLRANLWTRLERLMDHIQTSHTQVMLLMTVLAKRRDPLTHLTFMEQLESQKFTPPPTIFWEETARILSIELRASTRASSQISQALETEYPRLLRLFKDLFARLKQPQFSISSEYDPEVTIRIALASFETSFLSRSFSRVSEPVNLSVSSRNAPSSTDITTIVKTFRNELQIVSQDMKLLRVIAQNICKGLKLFSARCEQILKTGPEAVQVITTPTQLQTKNQNLVTAIYQLYSQTQLILSDTPSLPSEAVENLEIILNTLRQDIDKIISPLISQIQISIQMILTSMHEENFNTAPPHTDSKHELVLEDLQCSHFMKELQSFISRIHMDHLVCYECGELLQTKCEEIVTFCIEAYVQNCCLVRPLGDHGLMRMTADMAQIELAVAPLCKNRLSDLGHAYRMLRCLRKLVYTESKDLTNSQTILDVLPRSFILFHLISRTPPSFKSPQQLKGWSTAECSDTLLRSTETVRLELLHNCLSHYEQSVSRNGEVVLMYPYLKQLLNSTSK